MTLRQAGGSVSATLPKEMADPLRLEAGDRVLAPLGVWSPATSLTLVGRCDISWPRFGCDPQRAFSVWIVRCQEDPAIGLYRVEPLGR